MIWTNLIIIIINGRPKEKYPRKPKSEK